MLSQPLMDWKNTLLHITDIKFLTLQISMEKALQRPGGPTLLYIQGNST